MFVVELLLKSVRVYPLGSPESSFDEPWKEKHSDIKYLPTQVEIGYYALFLSKASIELEIEDEGYLILSQSAVLILIRDNIDMVLEENQ